MPIMHAKQPAVITVAFIDECMSHNWGSTLRLGGTSLEEEVALGDGDEQRETERTRTPLHHTVKMSGLPVLLVAHLTAAQAFHGRLKSFSGAVRYSTRAGLRQLHRVLAVAQLQELMTKAYEERSEAVLQAFLGKRRLNLKIGELSLDAPEYAQVFSRVHVHLSQIARCTGLTVPQTIVAACIAGLAQSDSWLDHRAQTELIFAFRRYVENLEQRVAVLGRLVV